MLFSSSLVSVSSTGTAISDSWSVPSSTSTSYLVIPTTHVQASDCVVYLCVLPTQATIPNEPVVWEGPDGQIHASVPAPPVISTSISTHTHTAHSTSSETLRPTGPSSSIRQSPSPGASGKESTRTVISQDLFGLAASAASAIGTQYHLF